MTVIIEDTVGKIRSRPIHLSLRRILMAAGELANVDVVRVTSGGQLSVTDARAQGATKIPGTSKWKLPGGRIVRTGSTRHDNGKAADLRLENTGRALDFNSTAGQKVFEDFAEYSVSLGATGLGAGINYMGTQTMHVGFGTPAVWNKRGIPALSWLVNAVARGRRNPINIDTVGPPTEDDTTGTGRHQVVARSGLRVRGGPSTDFEIIEVLPFGMELDVIGRSASWAKVDLQFDGTPDGFVHGAFLRSA